MNIFQHVHSFIVAEIIVEAAEIILFQFQTWLHVK